MIIFSPKLENYQLSQPRKIFLINGNAMYVFSIFITARIKGTHLCVQKYSIELKHVWSVQSMERNMPNDPEHPECSYLSNASSYSLTAFFTASSS